MLMLKAVIYEGLPSMKMEIYGMFKIVCLYFPLVEWARELSELSVWVSEWVGQPAISTEGDKQRDNTDRLLRPGGRVLKLVRDQNLSL